MPSPITTMAKRMHRAYERRMKLLHLGYKPVDWDDLSGDDQAEFLEHATIIHTHRDMHTRDLATLLCEHHSVAPGRDNVAYFVRRIREAKGPLYD